MKYIVRFFVVLCVFVGLSTPHAYAQAPEFEYEVGRIVSMRATEGAEDSSFDVRVQVTKGSDAGEEVALNYVYDSDKDKNRFHAGDRVVVYRSLAGDDVTFFLAEEYRMPQLFWIVIIFALLVVVTTRLRGVFAFVGLILSGIVIIQFIVPQILDGKNPFVISAIGALVILYVSVFTAHGLRPRTVISAIAMTLTIILAIVASYCVVGFVGLNGLGSEEAFMVQFGLNNSVNAQGLLLGGIIIGVLGVLDDVVTAQVAAVEELYRANHNLSMHEIFRRGFSVGKEHIISLVNTLVLAYAGASLPIFLLLTISAQPWWVTINSEPFAEEIIRALVGSMALIVAVPLATALAAYCYTRKWFQNSIVE